MYNILITGVGGQGVVLLGNILREHGKRAAHIKNVVGTETRGVSQREGSVLATARYLIDSRIYSLDQNYQKEDLISPLIPTNDAHLVLGLEPLETLRNIKYISEKSLVILNTNRLYPRNVITGSEKQKKYPSTAKIIDILDQLARRTVSMNFNELSTVKFKSAIYANTIILGVAVQEFIEIFDTKQIISIIEEILSDYEKNLEAFDLGFNLLEN
ncbi:MAG: hypothetical protein GF383_14075 [Candidatus Lokiarchaeota archaeon]|nr:hypothetical protein [Candidatus Lokiarchaeota archaeon]MBD3342467.1 hypothetical protein [Candidatus Lokiarchaeota archaeon]